MSQQFEINFELGLIDQYTTFREVCAAAVSNCGRPQKHVAADLDMTASELSRKLADNPNDPVHFPIDKLPELILSTGDMRPVHWLIEKFCDDPDSRHRRQVAHLTKLMGEVEQTLKSLKVKQ